MLRVAPSNAFKKDLKKIEKDAAKVNALKKVVDMLANGETLPFKYHNHKLSGNYADCLECHVKPDLLLIYQIDNDVLILALLRLGSHAELF